MSAVIRVLVADDEPLARAGVCALLAQDPEVAVVGEAADGEQTVQAIAELRPDLVMLDVQMPGMTGLDVIRAVGPENMPAIVMITAYDAFAVRAFEVNAVDYLLKPFDDDRFAVTLERAKQRIRQTHAADLSQRLAELLRQTAPAVAPERRPEPSSRAPQLLNRLVVKSGGRVLLLPTDDIDWVEAADYYVKLHVGGATHLLRETMHALEARLDARKFFRVHRSAIVNLDRIREMQPFFRGEYVLILKDGTRLRLSRSRRERLEQLLRQEL